MNHPAELAVHKYFNAATNGDNPPMSPETIETIANDIKDALTRQFGGGNKRDEFRLRMSNIGRPTCQLWFQKNMPEEAEPKPSTFVMNMMIGDIVEAVFKGILTESGVDWEQPEHVTLEVGDTKINGTYDIVINKRMDDIKSASPWSYNHKFDTYETLAAGDAFGYVGQLAGYTDARKVVDPDIKVGGWWVVNKGTGEFKYVPADNMDVDAELAKIKDTVEKVNANEFERCFPAEKEKFYGKESGRYKLGVECGFCDFKSNCWKTLSYEESGVSKAKVKPMVYYVEPEKENTNGN